MMDTDRALTPAEQFFYDNAGYSHRADEDPKVGHLRTARALAVAEAGAAERGWWVGWETDRETDSSDFSDEVPAWILWRAYLLDDQNHSLGSLGGVDFGRDGSPVSGSAYARVVEAELAAEHINEEGTTDVQA
jgi:hypothetical protein